MTLKWTEETTLKFVQEYLQHPVMYNCKDHNYKNKGARDAALNKISQNMKMPGMGSKEVYSKIRSLKSTYSQEAKRVKQSFRSGAGAADIYVPQIKWFKLWDDTMNAINIQYRDSQSNIVVEAGHEHEDTLAQETEKENVPDTPQEPETQENKSPVPKKRTIRDLSCLVNKVKSVADTIYSPPAASQSGGEFDIFGKSVAAQLNSLPLSVAIQGQMFIQNYLCSLRLQAMSHGTSLSPSPSPQSLPTTPSPHPPSPNTISPQPSPSFIFPPQPSPKPLPSATYIPARQTIPSQRLPPSTTLSSPSSTNILHADQSGNQNTETLFLDDDSTIGTITLPYSDNEESETQDDILALAVQSISE